MHFSLSCLLGIGRENRRDTAERDPSIDGSLSAVKELFCQNFRDGIHSAQ
jgi:hypothetical protein